MSALWSAKVAPTGQEEPDEGVLVASQVEVVQAEVAAKEPEQVRHAQALVGHGAKHLFSRREVRVNRWEMMDENAPKWRIFFYS